MLAGAFVYVKETLQGKTKPNKVTWLMWSIAPLIATAAAFSDGARWAVLPTFMAGFATLLVFIASFVNPKSYWKLEKFDYLCGIFSLLALILWAITKEPLWAVFFAIVGDSFAAIPTIIKSWKYPETESGQIYIADLLNILTSFFAFKNFNLTEIAFPIYLVLLNSFIIIAVYRGRWKK